MLASDGILLHPCASAFAVATGVDGQAAWL
jgi:hypothetical protein